MTDLLETPESTQPGSSRWKPSFTKIVLIVVCLLILAMWVYAFGFASKKAAYRVDDAAWRQRAQTICKEYEAKRLELVDTAQGYIAQPTHAQMLQRADVVDKATDILEDELAQVIAVQPADPRDRSLIAQYAGYYRTVFGDRRAYTERLRAFDLQPYGETLIDGGPVSNLLTDFTIVNEMPACS
ncbi:MAG: hypothetical protein JWN99_3245, partial [Ilumatobacteraceae bacterium]|nr:hypothetical protein [Ilumatobacteraceae bacterium]